MLLLFGHSSRTAHDYDWEIRRHILRPELLPTRILGVTNVAMNSSFEQIVIPLAGIGPQMKMIFSNDLYEMR